MKDDKVKFEVRERSNYNSKQAYKRNKYSEISGYAKASVGILFLIFFIKICLTFAIEDYEFSIMSLLDTFSSSFGTVSMQDTFNFFVKIPNWLQWVTGLQVLFPILAMIQNGTVYIINILVWLFTF